MLSINKTMEGIMAENNIGKITQVIGAVIDISSQTVICQKSIRPSILRLMTAVSLL